MLKVNLNNGCDIKTNSNNNNNNKKQTSNNNKEDSKSTDLGILNNHKKDLISFNGALSESNQGNPLDRFTVPPNIRMGFDHAVNYIIGNASPILTRLRYSDGSAWAQTSIDKAETMIPWKMHIYADTEEDWVKLTTSVGRYLNTKPVIWKTLSRFCSVNKLNNNYNQKGKAFTIYPASKEQFKQLASDIDYIIRLNNLEKEDSDIIGDRKLGNTGRIFYRYGHNSGQTKDRIYRNDNDEDMEEFGDNYDPNRGQDEYLASDMTIEDDPFYEFNP